ncbi:MAG TPA: ComEC/Rec2 family competence protein [Anaerolineales bacterium]
MPLLWLSLAFLSGIVLGEFLGWPTVAWLALAGFALALLLLRLLLTLRFRRFPASNPPAPTPNLPRFPFPLPLLFIFVALGAARYLQTQPQFNPGFIAWYNGLEPESVVVGVLVEPPDRRDTYTNLRLQVEQLSSKDDSSFIPVQGLLLAKVEPGGNWRYGDRVRLQGALQAPPQDETFSYRDYLARQGIYAYMPSARASLLGSDQGNRFLGRVYHLQENGLAVLYRLFPDPEASLLAGILLGVETGIPGQVQQAFQATGTAHIIAISGQIAIITISKSLCSFVRSIRGSSKSPKCSLSRPLGWFSMPFLLLFLEDTGFFRSFQLFRCVRPTQRTRLAPTILAMW